MDDPRIPHGLSSAPAIAHDIEVDASGLFCPIPIVRAAAALRALNAGQVVRVVSTDPGFVPDVVKWSRHRPDPLIRLVCEGESRWVGWIRKG